MTKAGEVVSNTIFSAKNSAETERHNKELEQIARGIGFNKTDVKNTGLLDSPDKINDLMLLLQSINNNMKELSNEQKRTAPLKRNGNGPMSDD